MGDRSACVHGDLSFAGGGEHFTRKGTFTKKNR
jgi:hypothetical protein